MHTHSLKTYKSLPVTVRSDRIRSPELPKFKHEKIWTKRLNLIQGKSQDHQKIYPGHKEINVFGCLEDSSTSTIKATCLILGSHNSAHTIAIMLEGPYTGFTLAKTNG